MEINKEKILVIAYLSEPNTLTGTQRTKGYMSFLHKFGYHPILISKNWNKGEATTIVEDSATTTYLLDIKESLREKLIRKYKNKFTLLRKGYNLTMKVLMCFDLDMFFEYNQILKMAYKVLDKDRNIKKVIVISDPYEFFYIGYRLNKKYGVKWIADYRDPWNTSEHMDAYNGKKSKFLHFIESSKEKKWVGRSSYVACVSEYCTQKIADFVKVPGKTIYNGFFAQDEHKFKATDNNTQSDKFTIVYSGTLHEQQILSVFANGFKQFIDQNPGAKIEVLFVGIRALEGAQQRIEKAFIGYEKYIITTDRIPQEELFSFIRKAQLLLTITLGKTVRGMISSKIFDYLLSGKPVLVSPLENDIVEQVLTETGQGFFADTPEEIASSLANMYNQFMAKGYIDFKYNKEAVLKYSRENQTKEMSALLDTL